MDQNLQQQATINVSTPQGAYAFLEQLAGKQPLDRQAGLLREEALATIRATIEFALVGLEAEAAKGEAEEGGGDDVE